MSATPSRQRAATRDRLLDATRALLVREGLQGVSVERICAEAGFTRGAFYSNFASKDELVMALVNRERERMLATVQEAAALPSFDELEPAQAIAAVLERFSMLQPPDREWFLLHLEFQTRGLRGDIDESDFRAWWNQIIDGIAAVMEAATAAMGLRLAIEPREACLMLMGTWDALVFSALADGREFDPSEVSAMLPRLILAFTEPAQGMGGPSLVE